MIRNFCLVSSYIIPHFYMRAVLADYFKTVFLRYFIISRDVIGILGISFPYHVYIITRNITYVNKKLRNIT